MLMTNKFLCRIGMKLLLCFIHEIAAHNWTFPSKFIGGNDKYPENFSFF